MRFWIWVAFAAHALSFPLSAQPVYYLPQVVDGPNVRTTIVLNNTAATSANLTISLVGDGGSPRQVVFPPLGAPAASSRSRSSRAPRRCCRLTARAIARQAPPRSSLP